MDHAFLIDTIKDEPIEKKAMILTVHACKTLGVKLTTGTLGFNVVMGQIAKTNPNFMKQIDKELTRDDLCGHLGEIQRRLLCYHYEEHEELYDNYEELFEVKV